MAVRLAKKIQETFQFGVSAFRFFTDSSCVLGMLKCDSSTFTEFVGTSSDVRDWKWIPTDMNLADLGTMPNVTPELLGPGTDFQCDMAWRRMPEGLLQGISCPCVRWLSG